MTRQLISYKSVQCELNLFTCQYTQVAMVQLNLINFIHASRYTFVLACLVHIKL